MEYGYLGDSGLRVSRLGLGTIPFGTTLDEEASARMLGRYEAAGGNYIDTANLYGGGRRGSNAATAGTAERTIGKLVKGRRDRFVIATKGYWLMEDEITPNSVGLSRAYLSRQIEASLARLGTDYIDLYQCHCWDFYTPLHETMRVLDEFVRAGKIRYVGVSNWDGWHVVKANSIAEAHSFARVLSNQIWYNLADRSAEFSILPACRDQKVSIIVWGALAQGFLTGAYRRGDQPPPGSRFDSMKDTEMSAWRNLAVERNWQTLDVLRRLAEDHGQAVSTVALRWLLQSGACDVVLLGADDLAQMESNLHVLDLALTDSEMTELREVSELPHPYPVCFYDLFCRHNSEFYGGLR